MTPRETTLVREACARIRRSTRLCECGGTSGPSPCLRATASAWKQIARERRAAPVDQPALFELRTDARPAGERTARERYAAPSLFTWQADVATG